MINDDEDNDEMYDGASGLKVFTLYLKLLSHLYFFFQNNNLYKYLVLIKYYCLFVIIAIGLYHFRIMT